jgi:DNA-binding NtrC family response regulator
MADTVDREVPAIYLERSLREAKKEILERFEKAYLAGMLRKTGGRIGETADRAGIQPRSLHEKMKFHGLRKEDFKPPKKARRK